MDAVFMAAIGVFVAISAARVIYADFASPEARLKRALARRRRVPIADAQDGLVRMTGRARPGGDLLRAPVSQRPCIAFHLVIEERGSNDWDKVLEMTDACPFRLTDESGTALVDTTVGPFSLALVPDRRGSRSLFADDGDEMKRVRALLESANVTTWTLFGSSKTFRFSEGALLPGSRASVGGHCAREVALDGERPTYREPPQRVVVRCTTEEPLIISNWRQAREEPDAR